MKTLKTFSLFDPDQQESSNFLYSYIFTDYSGEDNEELIALMEEKFNIFINDEIIELIDNLLNAEYCLHVEYKLKTKGNQQSEQDDFVY